VKRVTPTFGLTGLVTGLTLCVGCAGPPTRVVQGGDARRGPAAIARYGCGSCHVIPGVRTAVGTVGAPLVAFSRRAYIAGEVPNTAENLVTWITVPQAVEPGTAMPNLGVDDRSARDIAAYLYAPR
jgi:cytochrome c1